MFVGSRYRARATNRVARVGMNYLSDLIIRPGIEKRFGPLLLYRGCMGPGHAHRLWNMSLLMMAAEAETLADGIKILNNPDFSQLCGPLRKPGMPTIANFFGRLHDNPIITNNIEGLTGYVKFLGLGPCSLTRVDRFSEEPECAPWRKSLHPDAGNYVRKERGIPESKQLFYPYLAHDASKPDEGRDLVRLVNDAVPSYWPDYVRADACQELIVSVLSGEIDKEDVRDIAEEYVREVYRMHPTKYGPESLDAPFGDGDSRTLYDVVG